MTIKTRATLAPADKSVKVQKIVEEQIREERMEEERMQDVLLLLQHLVEREEATVKLILDCLYDIGSVNLINKKFRPRSLNRVMKLIATMTKPTFRAIAFWWFRRNCPQLIADWLRSKVTFR